MRFLSLLAVVTLNLACGSVADDRPGVLPCGIAPVVFDAFGDVVQGESDAGCARVERREVPLEEGYMCKACPYDPVRLVVAVGERFVDVHVDDEGVDLEYEATHHNWSDVVTATVGDEVTRVKVAYQPGGEWALEVAFDVEGTDPIKLPVVPR